MALLGDDPLPELLVVGFKVEKMFASQLLPDHVPQAPAPGSRVSAPSDGVMTRELALCLTLQRPGHLIINCELETLILSLLYSP